MFDVRNAEDCTRLSVAVQSSSRIRRGGLILIEADVSVLPDEVVLIYFVEVPSGADIFELMYFLKVLTVHHDVNRGVLVGTVYNLFAFLWAYVHSVGFCRFFQFGGEVMKFFLAASHVVHVVCKTKITNRSSTNRYGGVEVLQGLLVVVWWSVLKRTGGCGLPWPTPSVVLKSSPSWLFRSTVHLSSKPCCLSHRNTTNTWEHNKHMKVLEINQGCLI